MRTGNFNCRQTGILIVADHIICKEDNFDEIVGPIEAETDEEAIRKAAHHLLKRMGFEFKVLSEEEIKGRASALLEKDFDDIKGNKGKA
jgi:hypothetical protein